MDIKKYFLRIGLSKDTEPELTYEFLKKLQLHHVTAVPYENLDIIDGIPLSLDFENIYDKVVNRNRGGYCFELNCLFEHMLSELGFCTESYFARFWRGEASTPLRRHRVISVAIDGKRYIADVGIGSQAPRIPLLLEAGQVQEYFGEAYKFEQDAEFGWMLYELRNGEWQRYFSFTEERQLDIDFIQASFYCEKHPDSKFNKAVMVAIKTEEGRKSLDGNVYKRFVGSKLAYIEEEMCELRVDEILKNEFGLIR